MWKAFKNASPEVKAAIILGMSGILAAVIGGVFQLWNTVANQSTPTGIATVEVVATMTAQANTSATASAVAALQCPNGTLQSQRGIQTKVEDVPDGSALVVTLPTVNDTQNVILLANHSDLDKYVCMHDFSGFGATHKGPEIWCFTKKEGHQLL